MSFKKIALILFVLVLVAGSVALSTRDVKAHADGCYLWRPDMTLSADCDEIFFPWSWAAMTPGQVNEFVTATQDTITLRDKSGNILRVIGPTEIAQSWGPAYPMDPADLGVECGMPRAWVTDATLSLGSLGPGKYALTIERTFVHPVTDGFNACWVDGFKLPVALYSGSGSFTADFKVQ